MADYVEGKDKNQILKDMVGAHSPASAPYEQRRMAIIVRCTEDLERALSGLRESMNQNAMSADALATKVYWLTWVLAGAAVLAALAAVAAVVVPLLLHK